MAKREVPSEENYVRRFPRLRDKRQIRVLRFLHKLRTKYPIPSYNPKYDGSWNPGLGVLDGLIKLEKKKLKRMCFKHSLETFGSRFKLIRRMYLHWRASKLVLGSPYIGYGEGYKSTKTPSCPCGFYPRSEVERINMEKAIAVVKKVCAMQGKVFRLGADGKMRFPRLRKGKDGKYRFPRLSKHGGTTGSN